VIYCIMQIKPCFFYRDGLSCQAGRVAGACYVNARDEVAVAGPHGTPPHAARISAGKCGSPPPLQTPACAPCSAGYCGEYSTNKLAAMDTVESTPRISFLLCSVASCYVHESQIEREKRNKIAAMSTNHK
jgi:hypothetical protein